MQLWPSSDDEGGCCSVSAVRDARRVCDLLGIPHYTLNFRERFEREVVGPVRRRVRRGSHAEPVHRLQRPAEVRRPARAGQRSRCGVPCDRALREDRARRPAACPGLARGVDRREGPVVLPLPAHASPDGTRALPGRRDSTSPRCRGIASRTRSSLSPRSRTARRSASHPAGTTLGVIAERRPESLAPGDIVDRQGNVLGRHEGIARLHRRAAQGPRHRRAARALYVLAIDADVPPSRRRAA